jgi:hypothetical protein
MAAHPAMKLAITRGPMNRKKSVESPFRGSGPKLYNTHCAQNTLNNPLIYAYNKSKKRQKTPRNNTTFNPATRAAAVPPASTCYRGSGSFQCSWKKPL